MSSKVIVHLVSKRAEEPREPTREEKPGTLNHKSITLGEAKPEREQFTLPEGADRDTLLQARQAK